MRGEDVVGGARDRASKLYRNESLCDGADEGIASGRPFSSIMDASLSLCSPGVVGEVDTSGDNNGVNFDADLRLGSAVTNTQQ